MKRASRRDEADMPTYQHTLEWVPMKEIQKIIERKVCEAGGWPQQPQYQPQYVAVSH